VRSAEGDIELEDEREKGLADKADWIAGEKAEKIIPSVFNEKSDKFVTKPSCIAEREGDHIIQD
jgi:hypothetical protein